MDLIDASGAQTANVTRSLACLDRTKEWNNATCFVSQCLLHKGSALEQEPMYFSISWHNSANVRP